MVYKCPTVLYRFGHLSVLPFYTVYLVRGNTTSSVLFHLLISSLSLYFISLIVYDISLLCGS